MEIVVNKMRLSDEQVLTQFEQYLSAKIMPTWTDICNVEQAIAVARAMAVATSVPLSELTVAEITAFKRNLRDGSANRTSHPLQKAQDKLTLQRTLLAVKFFTDFRKGLKLPKTSNSKPPEPRSASR